MAVTPELISGAREERPALRWRRRRPGSPPLPPAADTLVEVLSTLLEWAALAGVDFGQALRVARRELRRRIH